MKANCTIHLFDVDTVQNQATGEREKTVVTRVKLNGEKSTVGMSTFWSAASANINLDYTVTIRSRMYKNQKYIYMENELYEVYNVAKADNPVNLRLNVRELKEKELKELIEDVMELLQTPKE